MRHTPSIAIVGAGPAGLTAAVILRRHDYEVTVYESEASATDRRQGGSLDLHEDKGQIALEHAGLLDAFRRVARHEDQQSKQIDPVSGAVQALPPFPGEDLDRPEIDRGALRDLLRGALPEPAIVWDARLERLETGHNGGHVLHFADGRWARADIVIGADGARSKVRSALTGVKPFYTGVTFLEGWIEYPSRAQAELVGRGTMFAFGGPEAIFAQRNGSGRICVYAAVQRSEEWLRQQSHLSAKALVKHIYRPWAKNLLDLLEACADFTPRPIYSLPPDADWPSPRGVCLAGDAAHLMPPMGFGVNLAMLDAAELVLAIIKSEDPIAASDAAAVEIRRRGREFARETIPAFSEWFAGASPFAG